MREISGASLRRAFSTTGPAAGWVAEADPRPQTNNQQLADMTFPAMELYSMPAVTQALLDDAVVVLFYTTKRVGGGVQNFEAIKLLKFAAS